MEKISMAQKKRFCENMASRKDVQVIGTFNHLG
jgi:hypothetical protein